MGILTLIQDLYLVSIIESMFVRILVDVEAEKRINYSGYEVVKGNKTYYELTLDFIKENIYHIVPIVNIIKSYNILRCDRKKYAGELFARLKKDGRLRKIENLLELPKEDIKPTKKEEKKPVIKQERKVYLTDEFIEEIEQSNDIYFISGIQKIYREKSNAERAKYNVLFEEYKTTSNTERKVQIRLEINKICKKVKTYNEIYEAAKNRINELQNTASILKK